MPPSKRTRTTIPAGVTRVRNAVTGEVKTVASDYDRELAALKILTCARIDKTLGDPSKIANIFSQLCFDVGKLTTDPNTATKNYELLMMVPYVTISNSGHFKQWVQQL